MTTDERDQDVLGGATPSPDATARMARLYREARETEAQLDALVASAPAILWRWEPERRCTYVSDAWTTLLGRDQDEALGSGWADSVHPDDVEGFEATCIAAMRAGRPYAAEYRLRRADGTYITVYDQGRPTADPDDPHGFAGAALDVSGEHLRRRRVERLETLSLALAGSRTAAEVADAVLVHALDALEAPHGALGLPTDDGRALALVRQRGFDPKMDGGVGSHSTPGPRRPARSRSSAPCSSRTTTRSSRRSPIWPAQLMPYRARAAMPLFGRERPLGVLYMAFDEARTFDAETVDFFEEVAEHVARTLERAMLADDRERSAAETRSLLRTSAAIAEAVGVDDVRRVAATAAREAVGADACLVALVDPATDELEWGEGPYPADLSRCCRPRSTPVRRRRPTRSCCAGPCATARRRRSWPSIRAWPSCSNASRSGRACSSRDRRAAGGRGDGREQRRRRPLRQQETAAPRGDRPAVRAVDRAGGPDRTRASASRELEGALSRLSRLQSVTAALIMAVRPTRSPRIVLDAASEALGGAGGAVFAGDGRRAARLALSGVAEESAYELMPSLRVEASVSLCDAYRTGHLVWVPTAEEWRRRYPEGAAMFEGVARSAIAIPFVLEDRVLGAMAILFEKERTLPRAERRSPARSASRPRRRSSARGCTRRSGSAAGGRSAQARRRRVSRWPRPPRRWRACSPSSGARRRWERRRRSSSCRGPARRSRGRGRAGSRTRSLERSPSTPVDAALPGQRRHPRRGSRRSSARPTRSARGTRTWTPPARTSPRARGRRFPFLVRGDAIGACHLSFAEPQPFDAEQVGELATIVGEAARAMHRAQRFAREREASIVLQESLLPRDADQAWHGAEVVTRYWAGTDHLEVGGDWYDVIELPNGRLGVVGRRRRRPRAARRRRDGAAPERPARDRARRTWAGR